MQVKRVKVASLKPADHNPKIRTKKGGALKQLERSIEKIGMIYPIAVGKDMSVIDGHRRLQACINLGWEEVPVLVVESDDNDAVYAEVNANNNKLTGCQNLSVWLKNPAAVTPRAAGAFAKWDGIVGRAVLQKMNKQGMSLRVLRSAQRIVEFTQCEADGFVVTVALWLIENRNARVVEAYMATQQPADKLFRAIKNGKAMRVTFAPAE